MSNRLRSIVKDNTSRKGKIFDYFIQMLIILSLASFSIEAIPDNSPETIALLESF